MNKILFYLATVLIMLIAKFGISQTDLSSVVPVDPMIRTGVLENGMTYYIRHNEEPKERASFYIIQNVGALLEEDNQNGLAHFLEHMAFNGTQHFEGKGILNTLEKHGVAFGRNVNAFTSFTETVYNMSDVPTTHNGLVDTCLLVLHDWADGLSLTEKEIDLERGVLTEEWRTRRNASFRMRSQWFPVLFKGSKYAVRDVIGDTTVIRYHEYDVLRNFYNDWYRTDNQAIAVVGDINAEEVEAKVKTLFSQIKAVENPKKKPEFKIPSHEEPYFVVATDKEAPQIQMNMYILNENKDEKAKTLNDMRDSYIEALYGMMSGIRIEELLQKGNPAFVAGWTQPSDFVRGYDTYVIGAIANPNEEARALETIMIETERIKRHGFLNSELERAKANFLVALESKYKDRAKITNDDYCSEISSLFLTKEATPGIEFTYAFANSVIPTITVEEISAKAKEWIKKSDRTLVITGPSEGVTHITEKEAKDIFAKVESMDIAPYVDAASSASLIKDNLKGSKIKSEKKLKDLNAVEWTLANNVKVVYRFADNEKDEVSLNGFSFGGQSIWDNQYINSATIINDFIGQYGVGDFDVITLQKMLSGKKVSVSPSIDNLQEGIGGSSSPADFETMMQLVYLYFEKPRFDKEAHDAYMSRLIAYVSNIEKDPRKIMQDSLSNNLWNYHPRLWTLNTESLKKASFEEMKSIYTDRIKDAGDFTFIIVGNIPEETVKANVQKYLGSLKDSPRKETWVDRGMRKPDGTTKKVIPIALTTPKANVNVFYSKEIEYNQKNKIMLSVLKGILDLRYTEKVREDEGGTYGVRVSTALAQYPISVGSVSMSFDCDPKKADLLKSIIYNEIQKIVNEGPTAVDFDKTIKNMLKDREEAKNHNSFWSGALFSLYYSGINTADPANFEEILKKLTVEDVKSFLKDFINDPDLIDIVFVPKAE